MKILNRFSMSVNLFIAPVVIIFILLGLAFFFYVETGSQRQAFYRVVNVNNRKVQISYQIIQKLNEAHGGLSVVLAFTDSGLDDAQIERVRLRVFDQIDSIRKQIADFSHSYVLDDDESSIVQRVNKLLPEYLNSATSMVDLAKVSRMLAIPYMDHSDVKYRALYDAVMDLIRLETDVADETFQNTVRQGNSRQKIFLAVIVGAICFSLLITILLSREISAPLNRIVKKLREASDLLALSSEQVSEAGRSLEKNARDQMSSVEETSSILKEILSQIELNAQNAGEADDIRNEALRTVQDASDHVDRLTVSMNEIIQVSDKTFDIVKTIDEIAFKTNLLALNAAVEAARAGTSGLGFSVVAGEVRNLAKRTAESAKTTFALIEETSDKIKNGATIVGETYDAFEKVGKNSAEIGSLVGKIAVASKEQMRGIHEISSAVAVMNRVTQENAANSRTTLQESMTMNDQAEKMKTIIGDLVTLIQGRLNQERGKKVA